MTYETAKKLKDGGWPQKPVGIGIWNCKSCGGDRMWKGGEGEVRTEHASAYPCGCSFAYEPTLEELIEACSVFGNVTLMQVINGWKAVVSEPPKTDFIGERPTIRMIATADGGGETHIEAVANLWLTLQEKNK